MRVLICGGRDFKDRDSLNTFLDDFASQVVARVDQIEVAHGGAPGADYLAHIWATQHGCKTVVYPANWHRHGRAAGPIRNKWMLEDFQPDVVIAFPGGSGTAHMADIAAKAGITVYKVPKEPYVIVEAPSA